MGKTAKAVFIACIVILLSLICSALALAQPSHIPHEDPNTAESGFAAHSVFDAYSSIFRLLAEGEFDAVSSALTDLEGLQLPQQIQSVFDLYHDLVVDISNDINYIEAVFGKAKTFIDTELLAGAESMLDAASEHLALLNIKTADLNDATEDLKTQLSVFVVNSSLFESAYQNYLAILVEVDELNIEYEGLLEELEAAIYSTGIDTEINLFVSPDEDVFVGDEITLSGELSPGLAGRNIIISLDGSPQITLTTDADGNYSGSIDIPYDYKSKTKLSASYAPMPESADFDVYKASYVEAEITVNYYDTKLQLDEMPTTLLVGFSNTISGSISGDGASISQREINFYLNKDLVGTSLTDTGGSFSVSIEQVADFELGIYTLRSIVLPDNDSRSNGKTTNISVELTKITPTVQINAPGYIISFMSRQLSGNVSYQQQPVADADVTIVFGNTAYETKTDERGDFNVLIALPALSAVMGNQNMGILVQPLQQWLNLISIESNVMALSTLNMGFFSAFMVAMGVVILRRRKALPELTTTDKVISNESKLTDAALLRNGDGVLSAYYDAVALIGELSGVNLEAYVTLREYLDLIKLKEGTLSRAFSELTYLAESALYAPNPLESDGERAWQLLDQLKGGIIGEPA
ncbi:hypothetical protein ACFLXN_02005 [Chloroflexota bacterium]